MGDRSSRTQAVRTYSVGQVARAAGVTVRTLHHYDRLGLLSPSSRTPGGHRCYTSDDVVQLHRIIALRSCGLSLEEIGTVLSSEANGGLADLLRRQLEVVDERIRQTVALRIRLLGVLDALERMIAPSITEILRLIEGTTTMNQPLTAERFAQLTDGRTRQMREMSAGKLHAIKEKMERTLAALSRDEQSTLAEQRRMMLPAIDDAEG